MVEVPETRQRRSSNQTKSPSQTDTGSTYKTSLINNRRYLGNKYKLLPFITKTVAEHCVDVDIIADIFSGTGAVASAFLDKQVITNDIMYSNHLCHLAWFSPLEFRQDVVIEHILRYNELEECPRNYMTENFSDTFFSESDCSKIGYIREDIENLFMSKELNERERALLLTALLYGMDKIANTCGHYDAYRKGALYTKHLELAVPIPQEKVNQQNQCFHMDANELVKEIYADLVYIDPPYNSRQYCDAYHLLENVARWEKPEVFGVARKMDRTQLKSAYCTRKAPDAFSDLVEHINARYILLSYNNMEQKGNDRSNARISDDEILEVLSKKGEVSIFSEKYKAFTTGKSDHQSNEERLFLCECYEYKK